jgi:phosphonoacetate hydrolase
MGHDNGEQDVLTVNGRDYRWPRAPVVVVCIDGSEPGYIEAAVADGSAPFFARTLSDGTDRLADCVVPSFTNPNNLSIVTGRPPSVHGICGNFFYDRLSDAEVMMNDPALLTAPTLFSAFQEAGARPVLITAKDKLRRLLGHGLRFGDDGAICFSAELAAEATKVQHGIEDVPPFVGMPVPSVYSAELSEFVFAAGTKIMARDRPDIMYLSTTDYIQHKHAPGTPTANAFYAMMDRYLGQLDEMGCIIAITADHGMNAKHDAAGAPDVIYLQSLLDEWLGVAAARVILPITDPYVVHHGALGSFATAYLPGDADDVLARLNGMAGISIALSRAEGCARFELPPERMGDIIIVSEKGKVLGTSVERHDLTQLKEPLRSHGGISEQKVPFLLNRATPELPDSRSLRNFDIFDAALNFAA